MGQISSTAMVWHTPILESSLTRAHPIEVFSSVLMTRPPQSASPSYPQEGNLKLVFNGCFHHDAFSSVFIFHQPSLAVFDTNQPPLPLDCS